MITNKNINNCLWEYNFKTNPPIFIYLNINHFIFYFNSVSKKDSI